MSTQALGFRPDLTTRDPAGRSLTTRTHKETREPMSEPRRRRSVSQTVLFSLLTAQLTEEFTAGVDVVDVGGGTGGIAIALASLGHRITVIDPSPDALASLERRTVEAGYAGHVQGVQGDATDLARIVGTSGADVVVCHRVLEVVESPADALAAMASVLRPGGVLSLLVPLRHAVVLSQALNGHVAQARTTFADPHRFTRDQVLDLVRGAGLEVVASHGIGAVADLVSEALIESDPRAHAELLALESEISQDPTFEALAPVLLVFARVAAPPPRSEDDREQS